MPHGTPRGKTDTAEFVSLRHRQLVDEAMNARFPAYGAMKTARMPTEKCPISATGHAECEVQAVFGLLYTCPLHLHPRRRPCGCVLLQAILTRCVCRAAPRTSAGSLRSGPLGSAARAARTGGPQSTLHPGHAARPAIDDRRRAGAGRIHRLRRDYGLARCRSHGEVGLERDVGWGTLASNLRHIAQKQATDRTRRSSTHNRAA
jgi:hypothetical protein